MWSVNAFTDTVPEKAGHLTLKQDDAAVRAFATEPKGRLRMESNRCDGRPRLISEPDTLATLKANI
jgi:hypothetical protein